MGGRAQSPVRAMVTAVDALVILLVVLAVSVGLGPAGWLAGIGFAVVGWAVLAEGRAGEPFESHGRVVLARAVLVGGLTALVVDTTDPKPDAVLAIAVLAAAVAVVGLGSWRLRPTAVFGARFATEVDAFFVLVLSAFVATRLGTWVLAIGVLHYVFLAAGQVVPWLRGSLPDRRTRTVIWAAQGIALTVVATGLLPHTVAVVLIALALAALAGSVAEDVWWLYRHRVPVPVLDAPVGAPPRRVAAGVLTVLAGLLVLVALVGPNQLSQLSLGAFARIPVEGLMGAALMLALPGRARRVAVVLIGVGLGLLTIQKMLDMGFYEVFDKPFHPVFAQ